ncbi:MAG: hypothetical protein H0V30_10520 [Chitinophagaceae bacterium]|nr:hypothetical protein [Chitinophagaceae bacterium]
MPRITFLVCSGISLISAASLNAQNFSRNPTLQQIVGYQLKQVQNWQTEQLPANSVLYQAQFKTPVPTIQSEQNSDEFFFEPIIRFPAQFHVQELEISVMHGFLNQLSKNQSYADWLKQSRWHLIKKNLGSY